MEKQVKRLFVGNIIRDTCENDLQKAFSRYGQIQSIELKQKANLVDPGNPTHFAFITIVTDDYSINKCLNRFSEKDFNGLFLNVSIAKESFLDKLKKEREEAENKKNSSYSGAQENGFAETKVKHYKQNFADSNSTGKRKTFDSDDELFEEPQKAIESIVNELEIDEEKPSNDNEKRIYSLKKMHKEYTQKKMLIQQALSGLDSNNSKKIKFDFYDSDEEFAANNTTKKVDLFQTGDDDYSDDEEVNLKNSIEFKQVLEAASGKSILKSQAKFNADPRFNMDKNFLKVETEESASENEEKTENDVNANEKDTQLRIMEEIVGRKLTRPDDPNRKAFPQTMIRYDPKNEEHQEIVNSMNKKSKRKSTTSLCLETDESKSENHQKNEETKTEVEVSKDQFYTINDDLKNSLKRRGDGFSLLSMFGRQDNVDENDNKIFPDEEKILLKSSNKQILDVQENPFKFDSSDSEDDLPSNKLEKEKISQNIKKKKVQNGKVTKAGVWVENFFIFGDDKRLKEGAEFFKGKKEKESEHEEEKEDYSKVKEQLRQIINKKISKSKKSIEGTNKFNSNGKSKRLKYNKSK